MSATRGQAVIKTPVKELGLGEYLGLCTGFTGAFVDYTSRGNQTRFIKLMQFIQETPDLAKKLKTFIERGENPEALTTEEEMSKEILALFKLIKSYQDKNLTPFDITSRTLSNTIFKEQKPLINVYSDEFIYTVPECCAYFLELQDILRSEKSPIVITISLMPDDMGPRITHAVGLSYNHDEDVWLLADINALSVLLPHESKEGIEIKKTTLQSIKGDTLPTVLKDRYFAKDHYISGYLNIYTRESGLQLKQMQLKFKQLQKLQNVFLESISDPAERTALHDGETIAHLAAQNNDLSKIKQLKQMMQKKTLHEENLLYVASRHNSINVMEFLLKQNEIPIDELNIEGTTPAFLAAQENNAEALELLVKNGANINLEVKTNGFAPIHVAAQQGSVAAMQILLKPEYKVNIDQQTKNGKTAASAAAFDNQVEILKLLKQSGANLNIPRCDSDYEPIHMAAQENAAEAIEFLIQVGVDPNRPTKKQLITPLHIAAANNSLKSISILVKQGADVNHKGLDDLTPLHYAVTQGNSDAVRTLIQLKANILAETTDGDTPLSKALENKNWDKALLLLFNVPFEQLIARDKWLIVDNGEELLNQLNKLCAITIDGNIDKIKLLQHHIFMLLHEADKLPSVKFTPMLKLNGLFKQTQVLTEQLIFSSQSSTITEPRL